MRSPYSNTRRIFLRNAYSVSAVQSRCFSVNVSSEKASSANNNMTIVLASAYREQKGIYKRHVNIQFVGTRRFAIKFDLSSHSATVLLH
jgi:hypothetical protein